MRRRGVSVILVLALLIGLAALYLGETGSCPCAEQSVGQPAQLNEFQAEVAVGVAVVMASIIGLVLSSFLRRTHPDWEGVSPATDGQSPGRLSKR